MNLRLPKPDNYDSGSHEAYAQAALDRICETIAGTSHGRNYTLNREAFSAGQLVGAGVLSRSEAERRLMAAAVASGYVDKDGAGAARATIASGLDKGEREPRVLPERNSSRAQPTTAAPDPAPKPIYVPVPVWTEPGPDGKPKLIAIGKDEPPVFESEIRRHRYRRAGGQIVRVKIKQKTSPPWVDWYLVRSTDAVTGWQAKRPVGYVPVPYLPASSPDAFATERRGEILAWPEGERDADTLRQHGFLAFTFGGSSDVPDLGELLCGHHVYITADNDQAGGRCISRKVEAAIRSGAASVKIVRFPELPIGGDATDFFEAGGTAEELLDRAAAIDLESWTRAAEEPHAPKPAPLAVLPAIRATPFVWRDPKTFPRRRWLYGHHLIRRFTSSTVAPGGIGKTSLVLVEALAMATGRNLLGIQPPEGKLKVWIINLEDPREEIERRIIAICLFYVIDPAELDGQLYVDSGRELKLVMATQTREGTQIAVPVVDALKAEIRDRQVDVLLIDPFVKAHRVPENDNGAIDAVCTVFAGIADECDCAVDLIHHVRKTNGAEVVVEDARGAVALLGAVRSARALNPMTREEAEKAGGINARQHFRVTNGKLNMALPSTVKSDWFVLKSLALGNSDHVQVVAKWEWPDLMDGVQASDIAKVQKVVAGGRWRENHQAKDWVGLAVAQVLKLDPKQPAVKKKIVHIVKTWIGSGMLVTVEGEDEKRNKRTFVEVGEHAHE